jgi:hypothetical protein
VLVCAVCVGVCEEGSAWLVLRGLVAVCNAWGVGGRISPDAEHGLTYTCIAAVETPELS